jgi:hypothetical protein
MGIKHTNLLAVFARVDEQGANGRLTLAEASALIAERVKGAEEPRLVRKRVRTQIKRSHEKGDDVMGGGLACGPDRKYTVDEIVRWARQQYPGRFDDLPTTDGRASSVRVAEKLAFHVSADQEVMPGNLAECQAELCRTRGLLQKSLRDLELAKVDYERRLKLFRNFPAP